MQDYELDTFSCKDDDVIVVRYNWEGKGTLDDLRSFVDTLYKTFPNNRVLVTPNDMIISSLTDEQYEDFVSKLPAQLDSLRERSTFAETTNTKKSAKRVIV